jgi:hypothetical protein
VDTVIYGLGQKLWRLHSEKSDEFYKCLYIIIASHRISGNLNLRKINVPDFWKKCNELEIASKYGHSEYWYIMNDLFKGITVINLFCTIYLLIQCKFMGGGIFIILTFLLWYRAKYYATIFIDTVLSTRDALNSFKQENSKM